MGEDKGWYGNRNKNKITVIIPRLSGNTLLWRCAMTTIYINGKKTPKEELKNIEIRNEGVKRIIRDALCRRERKKAVGG